jgi:Fic family protein
MTNGKPDIEADIKAAPDRGEAADAMTPLILSEEAPRRGELADLALELAAESAAFRGSLPPGVAAELARLVRTMNCYYSNLIEGHNTHPVDIDRAMNDDYSTDAVKRNLQLEAKAHVEVQKWIDTGDLGELAPTSAAAICDVHRRFCELLPEELLNVEEPGSGEKVRVVPGELRRRDVQVGRHVAISPGSIPRFLARFEDGYRRLGRVDAVLAAASAHHRLLWIHPFLDGNGRVARLMTHAMLLNTLDTGAVWSAARGLARRVNEYKQHLAACDLPRRNDLDGRGSLSEEALSEFTRFFLEVCIDQVRFMKDLIEPDRLRVRIGLWAEEEIRAGKIPQKSTAIFEALLYRGELPRGDVGGLLGVVDRQARRITSALIDRGVLASDTARAPLRLAFPAALAGRWMPGLFPEQADGA